jgi:hypothetical protein
MSLWRSVSSTWVVGAVLAAATAGFGQVDQGRQGADVPTTVAATAPATQPAERGADREEGGVRIILAPGATTQPSGPWGLIDQIIAAEETKPEKRDELRRLRELAQAVLGDDVTPAQLVKAAEPALLDWLQIDETVSLPPGVPANEDGPWSGIDPRLREATRWLVWADAKPDYLTVCSAHVLLDWLSDRISRRLAEHYMRLENLTLESDVYLTTLVPGSKPKLEMPETLPKVFSVRMWNQPHRSRAEVFVEGKFVWGVISERREGAWYLTEWTPKKREGPYHFQAKYQHQDPLRLLPAIGPAHLPVACNIGAYVLPVIGGDLVTSSTGPLSRFRLMAKRGRNFLGSVVEYDGIAHSVTGKRCHRFTSRLDDGSYLGHLYVSVDREAPYVCQLDGATVAYGLGGAPVGAGYGRLAFHSFSTDPIDDREFVAPDVPQAMDSE